MHVMIIDDHATNRELCRFILDHITERITMFENGQGVVEAMQQMDSMPDLILLDVMMPVKDGFTTAQEVREAFPNVHIPIIFLTALDDRASFERCLAFGDDFILKPVERNVLIAKVQAHYRIVKMHNEVMQQRDELSQFHEQVRYDYSIAESIFANLAQEMSRQVSNVYGIHYLSTPSTIFNGDLIVLAKRPHGGVYVMIADATGHGLPAAISALPATRAFFTMAAKGLPLGEIVTEINEVLVRFLPMGMMLAASVFEVRANGFEVSWWGGGLPDGYIVDPGGEIVSRLVSSHMPLGVLEPHEFEADIMHYKLEPDQQIVCYTDGVIEAASPNNEQFGAKRLEACFTGQRAVIPTLYEAVQAFSNQEVRDDLSILTMHFPITVAEEEACQTVEQQRRQVPIHASLQFDGHKLRHLSVMAEVRQFLQGMLSGGPHLDLICSVASELFSNAIEHGLLKLDSSVKDDPDGFFTYYQQREDKLKQLEDSAWVKLELDYQPDSEKVTMILLHNGEGFDYEKRQQVQDGHTYGRGIVLATELCDSLQYSEQGRKVTAIYSLNAPHHFPLSA
ncbi:fused response regulator/phosphatase [Vibrio cholerae]